MCIWCLLSLIQSAFWFRKGCADGSRDKFLEGKLHEAIYKLNAVKQVGNRSPRAAHRLLSTCVTKLLGFLAATAPPESMLPVLATFDDYLQSTYLHIFAPAGFECSQERMDRAKLKLSLPSPHGCGLFKTADHGRIAWRASVSACMSDPLLFKLRGGLAAFTNYAWGSIVTGLGGAESKFGRKQSSSSLQRPLVC